MYCHLTSHIHCFDTLTINSTAGTEPNHSFYPIQKIQDMMIKNICFGNTDFRLILTKSFDEETLLGDYFYSSVLSTALNHTVREIIAANKAGNLDVKIMQMQYKDSL